MPFRTINVPSTPIPVLEVLGNTAEFYTLANNDIVNSIWICSRRNFLVTDPDAMELPALGSAPLPTTVGTYARTNQATPVQCLLMPGVGGWTAAPSKIQASLNALGLAKDSSVNAPAFGPSTAANQSTLITGQTNQNTAIPNNIATTGAPGLNLKSATTLATNQAIAAGSTFTASAITGINQMAYNLHLTGTAGGASTKPWYTVTVTWVDTASGLTVQYDQFTAFMSSTSNVLSTVIFGPADADQMIVAITNNDTVSMTLNKAFVIISSRQNYTSDSMYQFFTTGIMPAVPTFQIAASAPVPAQKIIFSLSRTVGVGVTTTPDYALPGYAGQVAIGFRGVGSNQWNLTLTEQFTGTILYSFDIASANTLNALWILPRAPCTIKFTNNGSVLGTINCEIVGV